ncbi:MAG TPA: porin PorA family protein [Candidatus Limnocylindrales bacterium]
MRKGPLLAAGAAILMLGAAAAARFVVLPMVHQVPTDVDNTMRFSGTVSMLNPAALVANDASKLWVRNAAVTAEQHTKSVQTSGRTVVLSSDIAVKGPDSSTLISTNHVYSLDRVTLEAAPAPAGSNAETHTGLALGFPLTPQAKNYQYWDSTTQAANPASYVRTEQKGGRQAYVYNTRAVGVVKDPKLTALLPSALQKSMLPLLAANLPTLVQQALNLAMPLLPDSIAVTYTSTTDSTFWVDTSTGIVLDVEQKQVIQAQLAGPLAAAPLPPAFDLSIKGTEETVKANAESAAAAQNGLLLIGTYLPIGSAALGGILLLTAIIAGAVGRKREPAPEPAQAELAQE